MIEGRASGCPCQLAAGPARWVSYDTGEGGDQECRGKARYKSRLVAFHAALQARYGGAARFAPFGFIPVSCPRRNTPVAGKRSGWPGAGRGSAWYAKTLGGTAAHRPDKHDWFTMLTQMQAEREEAACEHIRLDAGRIARRGTGRMATRTISSCCTTSSGETRVMPKTSLNCARNAAGAGIRSIVCTRRAAGARARARADGPVSGRTGEEGADREGARSQPSPHCPRTPGRTGRRIFAT
jgi:hypothetical protein